MGEGARRHRRETMKSLMVEAGASPARLRFERAMGPTLSMLVVAGIALVVVGVVVGGALVWLGLAVFVGALALGAAVGWNRVRLIDKVRWQDGTVTFRTVEPGDVGENGQRVVCEVELNPPPRAARVATTVGPLDVERLVVGATMRCQFDRAEFPVVLRAFPYAASDAPLPSGRALAFRKAQRSPEG